MIIEAINIDTEALEQLTSEDELLRVKVFSAPGEAAKNGDFYSFTSQYKPSDGDYTIFLMNTDPTRNFHVVDVNISSKVEALFELFKAEGSGSGGVLVPGVNWNFSSPNVANVECRQDPANGSVTPVSILDCVWLSQQERAVFKLHGALVLGDGDAITVQTSKGDDDTCTVIVGYFAD